MKCNRSDVDKYKASKESNPFNIAAFIDKNQAAVVSAAVDKSWSGRRSNTNFCPEKLLLAQEMTLKNTSLYAIKVTR